MNKQEEIQNIGKETLEEFGKYKKHFKILMVLLVVGFIGYLYFKPAPELTSQQKIENQFSPLNGKHNKSVIAIKESMKDPSSFEHVETKYWITDSHLKVMTTFRGANSFGALVVQTALTNVDKEDGEVLFLEFQ